MNCIDLEKQNRQEWREKRRKKTFTVILDLKNNSNMTIYKLVTICVLLQSSTMQ